MSTESSRPAPTSFGSWLQRRISERGWSQRETADRLGTSHSTVSRWLHGRIPEASLLERIADVFVEDYDYVATLAGVRPRELLEIDPDSATGRLMPLIEQIDWETNPERLPALESQLRTFLEWDRKNRAKE